MNPETMTTIPRVDDALPFDGSRWNRYFSNWMNGVQAQAATWNDQDGDQLIDMDPVGKTVGIAGVIDADASGIVIGAPVTVNATTDLNGNTTITGAVEITGNTNMTGTLIVSSTTTLNGALLANGAVTLGDAAGDAILVKGSATFNENVVMVKNLTVDTTTLVVDATNNKVGIGVVPASTDAMLQVAGSIRATALTGLATSGSGLEMQYDSSGNIGYLTSVSRPSTFRALEIYGSSIKLMGGAANKLEANATGVGFNGTAPVAPAALTGSAAAAYDATTRTLINDIKALLQGNGLAT